MLLPDVNILVHAYRRDSPLYSTLSEWLEALVNADEAYGISDLVCSGFLRIVSNPKIFDPPSPVADALVFLEQIRSQPNCMIVAPGLRHWGIFTHLCTRLNLRANLVPDAYLAAIAIESGCEWVTLDRDFSRFPSLRWRQPYV